MNRQSRRHPSSSLLPDFYASKKSIIVENQKRNSKFNQLKKEKS